MSEVDLTELWVVKDRKVGERGFSHKAHIAWSVGISQVGLSSFDSSLVSFPKCGTQLHLWCDQRKAPSLGLPLLLFDMYICLPCSVYMSLIFLPVCTANPTTDYSRSLTFERVRSAGAWKCEKLLGPIPNLYCLIILIIFSIQVKQHIAYFKKVAVFYTQEMSILHTMQSLHSHS